MKKNKILFSIFGMILMFFAFSFFSQVEAKYVIAKGLKIPYTTAMPDKTSVNVTVEKSDDGTAIINAIATDNGAGIKKYEFYINNELKETITTSKPSVSYNISYVATFGTTYDIYVIITDEYDRTNNSNTVEIADYTINTTEDFIKFRDSVNNENKTYKGEKIIQTADRNLNCSETNQWIPIGEGILFEGIYEGNNYSINGIYIDNTKNEQALFGRVGESGVIKNVNLKNGTIKGRIYSIRDFGC